MAVIWRSRIFWETNSNNLRIREAFIALTAITRNHTALTVTYAAFCSKHHLREVKDRLKATTSFALVPIQCTRLWRFKFKFPSGANYIIESMVHVCLADTKYACACCEHWFGCPGKCNFTAATSTLPHSLQLRKSIRGFWPRHF